LIEVLRHRNNRVKAHFRCFQSKAVLFFHIIADLNEKVDARMMTLLKEFVLLKLDLSKLSAKLISAQIPTTRNREERTLLLNQDDVSIYQDIEKEVQQETNEEEKEFKKSEIFDIDFIVPKINDIVRMVEMYIKAIQECYSDFQKYILKEFKTRKHINVMVQFDRYFRKFTTEYSNINRKIFSGDNIDSNIDPDKNLTVIEFKFCFLGNYFRQILSKGLTEKYHQIGGKLEQLFGQFEELQDKLKFVNCYLEKTGNRRRIKHKFKDIENCWKMVSFFYLLDSTHQKFIKNKLSLPSDVKVFNEELFDFMDMYSMTYDSNTPLILEYLEGKMSKKKDSPKECVLCLDVRNKLNFFRFLGLL